MTDTIVEIPLDEITLRDRLRPVSEADMLAVAASFAERGQDQPVLLRRRFAQNELRLVAGAHRVTAARYLGWTSIKAIVREMTDEEARIAEIDENLIRRELTVLDRAVALKERKDAYEAAHPEAAHGKAKKPKKGEEDKVANLATFAAARFTKDAAAKTGISERTIRRAVQLLSDLDPQAMEVLRLSPVADNQAQLFSLAALAPEAQRQAAAAIGAGKAKTVKAAQISTGLLPETRLDPQQVIITRFVALAAKASPDTLRYMAEHVKDRLAQKRAKDAPSEGEDA
jgi:ParB family transcriptional regulator, chromosome partitioning protein